MAFAASVRTGQLVRRLPRSLDQVYEALGHKLINVVVKAVVNVPKLHTLCRPRQ
jgi:ABC-type uncharacterized transport system permease subunit